MAPWQFVMLRPEKSSLLPKVDEQVLIAGRVEGTTVVELPEQGEYSCRARGGCHGPAVPPPS